MTFVRGIKKIIDFCIDFVSFLIILVLVAELFLIDVTEEVERSIFSSGTGLLFF